MDKSISGVKITRTTASGLPSTRRAIWMGRCNHKKRRLQPDSVATHYNLGATLERKGRTSEAIVQFQAALRPKPDLVEVTNLITRLERKIAAAGR